MRAITTPIAAAVQVALLALPSCVSAQSSAGAAPPPAAAAASAPAPASSAQAPNPVQLEVVTVTAQRRPQKGQDVPISMTVVPASVIEGRGIADPLSLSQVAPTLQVGEGNNYSVRGIGTLNTAGNQLLEGAVATAIDGVNLARSNMANLQFADLVRVEVLNGPQGMLFGKNATGGLINISTARPVLGVTEGRLRTDLQHRTSGAAGNGLVAQGIYNTPLSENSALRLNVFGTQQQPLLKEYQAVPGSNLGEKQSGIKLKYLWTPTDDLSVYLIGDYTDRTGAAGTPFSRTRRSFGPGSFVSAFVPQDLTVSPENAVVAADGKSDYRFKSKGLQAEVTYELGGGYSLVNIFAHRSFREITAQDGDGIPVNFLNTLTSDFTFTQDSNELRVLTPAGGVFEGQMGVYLFRSKTQGSALLSGLLGQPGPVVPGTTANIGGASSNDLTATNSALFGQGTFKLNNQWRLLAGLRYTRETQKLRLTQDDSAFGLIKINPTVDTTQSVSDNSLTWKFGTQVDLMRDVMAYATYAHGAKGPGFNNQVGNPSLVSQLAVRPEKVNALELGVKSSLLDRRVTVNASVFNQDYTDLQVQAYNAALQSIITQNAGKSRSRGAELQVQAKPSADWLLSASAVWLDAKFTSFANAQCYLGAICDASGQRLPNSPRGTFTAQAEYKQALTSDLRATYSLDVYHRSSMNFAIADPGTVAKASTLLGASVALGDMAGDWRVSLYCRNCLDTRVVTGIGVDSLDLNVPQPPTASYLQLFGYNSFRTVGLTAERRF